MRRVRRLHLRATTDEEARRAATLLGDALRTASLPAADSGRMVVVRRLALGRISTRVSPASLALHIERMARDMMSQAVTYDSPAAAAANVVVFPDRSDAIITLAGLHAAGFAAHEWFWPEIVPGWRGDAPPGECWSWLLRAAHAVPGSALVASAIIRHAIDAGVEDALLASAPPGQGASWLRAEGWTNMSPDAGPPLWRPPTARPRRIIERWRAIWGPHDDRLVWLGAMMAVLEQPACVADPRLPARVAFGLKPLQRVGPDQRREPEQELVAPADGRTGDVIEQPKAASLPIPSRSDRPPAMKSEPQNESAANPVRPPAKAGPAGDTRSDAVRTAVVRPGRASPPLEIEAPVLVSHEATAFAGLLFVVPVLERLGFAAFLTSHSTLLDGGFPARLLWAIGQRVGQPPDDPLARALRAEVAGADDPLFETATVVFDLPTSARDILASPKVRAPIDSPLAAWLTAVRRWSRRHLHMGLRSLICRPGRVHASRTHIGASFPLSQLDLRLRRVALDVDPGWVPWMGRVVEFNYGEHHDRW